MVRSKSATLNAMERGAATYTLVKLVNSTLETGVGHISLPARSLANFFSSIVTIHSMWYPGSPHSLAGASETSRWEHLTFPRAGKKRQTSSPQESVVIMDECSRYGRTEIQALLLHSWREGSEGEGRGRVKAHVAVHLVLISEPEKKGHWPYGNSQWNGPTRARICQLCSYFGAQRFAHITGIAQRKAQALSHSQYWVERTFQASIQRAA